jgi:Glucodextranase, domain B/Bacterial Ig-like domain
MTRLSDAGRIDRPGAGTTIPYLCLLALMSLPAAASGATAFVVPGPTSSLYRSFVAVGGASLIAQQNCSLTGNLQSNGSLALGLGDHVTGNVSAVGLVVNLGTVSGTVTSGAPARALPALPTQAQALALANRVFTTNTTFNNAEIDDVVFVEGDVHIQGSLDGRGTLIVLHDLTFDGTDAAHPIPLAATTRLSILALHDIHVGQLRPLRGLLYAGHDADLLAQTSFQGVAIAAHNLTIDSSARLAFLELDTTPPAVSNLVPANGSLLATATPALGATFADDLSGVDPASVRLLLDGVDRTSASQVTAAGINFTPSAALPDGSHAAALSVRDLAGNLAQAAWSFTTDVTPPTLAFTAPSGQVLAGTSPPIAVAYGDATSGVDLGSLRVTLDAADISAACAPGPASATCGSPALAAGSHSLAASIRDQAGNPATANLTFQATAPPTIAIASPTDGSYSRNPSIQVTGTIGGPVVSVTVNDQAASLGSGTFTAAVTLAQGYNQVLAVAADAAGNQASTAIAVTLDTQPPTLSLATPAPGSLTNQPQVQVAGTATDDTGIALLKVAGQPVAVDNGSFAASVPVAEGANTIEVDAFDLAGNEQTATVTVTRFSIPSVVITSPPDLSYVSGTTLTVSGTVAAPVSVSVNGVAATLSGTTFTAPGVPLVEGGNTVTATATDAAGHVGLATINVVRDLTPPHVAIYTPAAGASVGDATVTVSGLVNDIVAGTVNAGDVAVSVNGLPATVANRSFIVPGVPLQPGDNVLTALAVDASGNQGQASITVRQAAPAGARVAAAAGSGQTAVIRTPLPQPLVAALLDATGHPVPGKPVLFRVRGGDGTVDGGGRDVAVTSDANGQARTHFTLGSRAGAGNQVVEASAPGFGTPAVFLASALPGPPALIVVDSGDQQLGVAGQALPRPLAAAVVDAGANRLPGIAATLRVVKGSGHFANGQQTLGLTTDSDGRLIAALTTDPAEGVAGNVVEARIDALPGGPVASFVASTWAAGDPGQTAVSGVVLDNSNLPVAGVTLRIRDTALTAVTDTEGLFVIAPAPVGTLKLIVDGSTAQRPGAWPDLEFDLTTVPGRNNTLRMPIYLLPLDLATGIPVDETHGGTLTLAQLPGFALDIQAGSVTFPGGGRSGLVSVTVVHSDKVPMVPNFGQQPRLIVTIQPAGARFDPPARLTMPNVEGLAPGQVTEFYSFDHDLGHFVSIGPGTVSDDGSVVTSNAGVGILKAGWHCSGNPQGSGTPNACPDCQDCTGSQCVNRTLCRTCNQSPGKACDGQGHCLSGRALLAFPDVDQGLGLVIGPAQPLGRTGDPLGLVNCPPGPTRSCFVAVRERLGPVTTTCDTISLKGALLTETESGGGFNGCPGIDVQTGKRGCQVVDGNQLISLRDPSQPCTDTHALCAPPPFPPLAPGDTKSCSIVTTQTFSLDGHSILTRTHTYTFVQTASDCTLTLN